MIILIHQRCWVGEVGEWKDKLKKQTGWNDVLRRAGKVAGSRVKNYNARKRKPNQSE